MTLRAQVQVTIRKCRDHRDHQDRALDLPALAVTAVMAFLDCYFARGRT
jgi:hypothetical protein